MLKDPFIMEYISHQKSSQSFIEISEAIVNVPNFRTFRAGS